MPIFVYKCEPCGVQDEERIVLSPSRQPKFMCPKCHDTMSRQLTVPGRIAFGHHKKLEVCELE